MVTSDVVLTQDLVCSGDGLIVPGYHDVTIDLHGHSILGSGAGTGIRIASTLRVDAASGPGAVTVEDGAIRGFDDAIALDNYERSISHVLLDRLSLRDSGAGIDGGGGSEFLPTTVSNSTIASNDYGVFIGFLLPFRMVSDTVIDNESYGIFAYEDSLSELRDSFIAHNGAGGAKLDDTFASVVGNTFLANAGTGLDIHEDACSALDTYLVSDNVANQNGAGGMRVVACDDSPPLPGSGNAANNNTGFECILVVCARNRGQAQKVAG